MQREQNLWGLQCLLWPAHAKLLIYAADSVLAFQFQAPTRFKNARCLFNCVSSTVYHSPYCYTVLNGFWTCPYIYMSALFCVFSSHKFLRLFTFAHPFFLLPFVLPFYFHYSFPYPIFPRTCFIALNFILLRASFDATISLPVSVFVSILAQRQASYNLYTSLLPQNSCYHAYFDHLRMVSS